MSVLGSPAKSMLPKRTRIFAWTLALASALLVLTAATDAGPVLQPSSADDVEYTELIRQYSRGDFQTAMVAFARWPVGRVRDLIRTPRGVRALDLQQTKAAAMLHSDVSMMIAVTDNRLSRQHADLAKQLVLALPNEAARFKERWQAYTLGPALVQHDLRLATLAMRQGLDEYPRSADLLALGGTIHELAARGLTADIRGVWMPNRQIEDELQAAVSAYRRALELDPALLSARLRLGWTFSINSSGEHAREQLRMVIESSRNVEQRYLAHLLLGGIAEQEGHPEAAYDEYEQAHAIRRDAQSAHLALMRVASMTGRVDRAASLAEEYARRAPVSEDPWWGFSMGLDTELSTWLHRQATQP